MKKGRRPQKKLNKNEDDLKKNIFLIPLKFRGKPFLGLAQLSKIYINYLQLENKCEEYKTQVLTNKEDLYQNNNNQDDKQGTVTGYSYFIDMMGGRIISLYKK